MHGETTAQARSKNGAYLASAIMMQNVQSSARAKNVASDERTLFLNWVQRNSIHSVMLNETKVPAQAARKTAKTKAAASPNGTRGERPYHTANKSRCHQSDSMLLKLTRRAPENKRGDKKPERKVSDLKYGGEANSSIGQKGGLQQKRKIPCQRDRSADYANDERRIDIKPFTRVIFLHRFLAPKETFTAIRKSTPHTAHLSRVKTQPSY